MGAHKNLVDDDLSRIAQAGQVFVFKKKRAFLFNQRKVAVVIIAVRFIKAILIKFGNHGTPALFFSDSFF